MKRIFISSVQKEFAQERAALRDYLRGDTLMRRFLSRFYLKTFLRRIVGPTPSIWTK